MSVASRRNRSRSARVYADVLFVGVLVLLAVLPSLVLAQWDTTGAAGDLGPVDVLVQKLWDLETRAIQQGQLAAGTLFVGLATTHLTIVALQSLNRSNELQSGAGPFVEQLVWTGIFGSAISFGPGWGRSIIDFFRNVGKSVATGEVTPQSFVDLTLKMLDSLEEHASVLNVGSYVSIAVCMVLALLAGLLALVIFYVETESHLILSAGAVLLGFGGAAATRDMTIRYFKAAVGSGLRLMVVEMINATVMNVLVAGAEKASAEGVDGLETASALMLGTLVVLGMIIVLPIVISSLASGSISAGAERAFASVPSAAVSGGLAAAVAGMFKGAAGQGAPEGKDGGKSNASADTGDSSAAAVRDPSSAGAVPPASATSTGAGMKNAETKSAQSIGPSPEATGMVASEGSVRGEAEASAAEGAADESAGTEEQGAALSAPLPAAWQGARARQGNAAGTAGGAAGAKGNEAGAAAGATNGAVRDGNANKSAREEAAPSASKSAPAATGSGAKGAQKNAGPSAADAPGGKPAALSATPFASGEEEGAGRSWVGSAVAARQEASAPSDGGTSSGVGVADQPGSSSSPTPSPRPAPSASQASPSRMPGATGSLATSASSSQASAPSAAAASSAPGRSSPAGDAGQAPKSASGASHASQSSAAPSSVSGPSTSASASKLTPGGAARSPASVEAPSVTQSAASASSVAALGNGASPSPSSPSRHTSPSAPLPASMAASRARHDKSQAPAGLSVQPILSGESR